jgi:hypothetical protein
MGCKSFLGHPSRKVVGGDKMMHTAWGPVWPTQQRAQGSLPAGRHGLDQAATWGKSHSDGWMDGHGSRCLVPHDPCVLGAFKDIRNSAHAANRLGLETGPLRGVITTVLRDRRADDKELLAEWQRQRGMTLWTTPRTNSDHTAERQAMIHVRNQPKSRRLRQQRGQTVEPRQAWSKTSSRWNGVGGVVIGTTVGSLRPWELPCRCIRRELSKRIARPGGSSQRS